MDKTPVSKRFIDELVKSNDQICYSALLHHEFEQILLQRAASSPDKFTSSIFPSNPFSGRLHRKARELPTFSLQSRETGFRMAIIAGHERVSAYLDEIQRFRAENKPSPEDNDNFRDEPPEEKVLRKLRVWKLTPPPGYFKTIGYFRHMRNSFAHAYAEPSGELASFARTHAHTLNQFWDNGRTELYGLDFKSLPSKALSADSAFAIMNLLRICVKEIDAMFASTLSIEDIAPAIVDEIVTRQSDLKRSPRKVVFKARTVMEMDYGEKFPISTVTKVVEPILKNLA